MPDSVYSMSLARLIEAPFFQAFICTEPFTYLC